MFSSGRYANVTATLALFLALGGVGYAAATLPKDSVGTKQIKSNAVKSPEVKNGSLLSSDFKAGQLPAGPAGPAGQTGPAGPAGPVGGTGPAGAAASRFFARIGFTGGTPTVLASSGGITVADPGPTGSASVTFPSAVNVNTCAFSTTLDSNAVDGSVRKSSGVQSTGSTAFVAINDVSNNPADIPFDIVAFC